MKKAELIGYLSLKGESVAQQDRVLLVFDLRVQEIGAEGGCCFCVDQERKVDVKMQVLVGNMVWWWRRTFELDDGDNDA